MFLDRTFFYQVAEASFIILPAALFLSVFVEHLLGGGERGEMEVFAAENLAGEKVQIVAFAEAGEVARIIQANIENAVHAGIA